MTGRRLYVFHEVFTNNLIASVDTAFVVESLVITQQKTRPPKSVLTFKFTIFIIDSGVRFWKIHSCDSFHWTECRHEGEITFISDMVRYLYKSTEKKETFILLIQGFNGKFTVFCFSVVKFLELTEINVKILAHCEVRYFVLFTRLLDSSSPKKTNQPTKTKNKRISQSETVVWVD